MGQKSTKGDIQEVSEVDVKTSDLTFSGMLSGKEGVYALENGQIGNSQTLMIRGINTVSLNASPIIYVDGIPMNYSRSLSPFLSNYEPSRFNFINPNDIKNIVVLKRGSDLSFYGGKGANGAIYIETDRGSLGGTQIDFSARFGILTADYNVNNFGANGFKSYLKNYYLENGIQENEVNAKPIFNPNLPEYNNNTNWLNNITRNADFQDYHLKLKGGDSDAYYMFSVGYTKKGETINNMDFQRINMRFNIDYKLSEKISISNNLSYSNVNLVYGEEGFNYAIHPIYVASTKAPFLSPIIYSSTGEKTNRTSDSDELGKSNPNMLVNNLKNDNEENRVDGLINALWDIKPNTSLTSSFAFNYFNLKEKQYRPSWGIVDDQNRIRQNAKRTSSESLINWNTWLENNGDFGNSNSYSFKTGFLIESTEEKSIFARKINAGSDDFETMEQGKVDSTKTVNYELRLFNYYLAGKLDLSDRFLLTANLNVEGSSNFGKEARWGIYPGISAIYDLFKRSDNKLSLQAGWGRSGNSDIRGSYHLNLYYPANYFGYGGLYMGNLANTNIKPEVTDAYDLGLRFNLLDNRINIETGYYYKNTSNLIVRRDFPIEIGLENQYENNGVVVSKGYEINIDAALIQNKNVSWSISGNISTLDNKVKELYNGDIIKTLGGISTISRIGESIGSFYGYKVLGVFQSESEINLTKQDGSSYKAGDYIMEDINNDHKINNNDRQILGSPLPDVFGSVGSSLKVKNFSFDMLFTYSVGNDIYNVFNQEMHSMKDYSNQSVDIENRWISSSQTGNGRLSRAAFEDPSGNSSVTDLWIEDGSYLKLKNITLNYMVPNIKNIKFIRELNVYFTVENLLTFTQYSGFDPEVVSSSNPMFRGMDFGASPSPKSFIMGVRLSL